MVTRDDTAGTRSGSARPADIFAQIAGMLPVAVRVTMEPDLECVAIELRVRGGPRRTYGLVQLLLTANDALDLASRLAGTVERWRKQQAREPEGGRGQKESGLINEA
jgi:hypothetical protein